MITNRNLIFSKYVNNVSLWTGMDLISKTAETDRLNPLVFKKREGLLELLPMHTQSAMASRAAMTVYGCIRLSLSVCGCL